MGNSGFFKGEKKKSKKNQSGKNISSNAPVFVLPELVSKKRKNQE